MTTHRWSRALYRRLLRAYPLEFRCHFRADLETDFAEMLAARGRAAAWTRMFGDWRVRSRPRVPTRATNGAARKRLRTEEKRE